MKKTFTLLFIVFVQSAFIPIARGQNLKEDFESPSGWQETHSNLTLYNKWVIDSCRVISGKRSAYVRNGVLPNNCNLAPPAGKSFLYKRLPARCARNYGMTFKWRCEAPQSVGRGSVWYSFDGVSWTRFTTGGPANDGYYYQASVTQDGGVSFTDVFSYTDFYIGFEYEITSQGNGKGFIIDDLEIIQHSTLPLMVSAGPDLISCPGERNVLAGTGQHRYWNFEIANSISKLIPDFNPAGVSSAIILDAIPVTVTASRIAYVMVNISHESSPDIDIRLTAPDGSSIDLSSDNGLPGFAAYPYTYFVRPGTYNYGPVSGMLTNAPYSQYTPEEPFTNLTGSARGTWKLQASDDSPLFTGTLISWSISFDNGTLFSWTPAQGLQNADSKAAVAFPEETTTYTFTVSDYKGCAVSDQAVIKVHDHPEITSQPADIAADKGDTVQFSVSVTEGTAYSWEEKRPGSAWAVLADNSRYSGTRSPVLTINDVRRTMNGNQYRCEVTTCSALTAVSDYATLTVGARTAREGRDIDAISAEIYPNPAKDKVNIRFTSAEQEEVRISIADVLGRNVSVNSYTGADPVEISLEGLKSGVYIIQLESGGKSAFYRIVKE